MKDDSFRFLRRCSVIAGGMCRCRRLVVLLVLAGCQQSAVELTIATFNAWGAGANRGEEIAATVTALRALDADVIALQEVRAEAPDCDAADCPPAGRSVAADLAAALGYHVFEQASSSEMLWANAILSRYPIAAPLPRDLGVMLDVNGARVAVLNVHLPDYPYQPYQLANIEYGAAPMLDTAEAAISAAESARGAWVDIALEVADDLAADTRLTAICGDFNEPSHFDWTEATAQTGRHPLAVAYPASRKFEAAGFIDGYRAHRPDEVTYPGFTWTPLAAPDDDGEHHDRIDFVYLKGAGLRVLASSVAGESADTADIVLPVWPSDHRAVVVSIEF